VGALEARQELSVPQSGCPAHAGLERHVQIDGLAADSTPGAGALHHQPQGPPKAGPGLVLKG
jgi:hypothetical protein